MIVFTVICTNNNVFEKHSVTIKTKMEKEKKNTGEAEKLFFLARATSILPLQMQGPARACFFFAIFRKTIQKKENRCFEEGTVFEFVKVWFVFADEN